MTFRDDATVVDDNTVFYKGPRRRSWARKAAITSAWRAAEGMLDRADWAECCRSKLIWKLFKRPEPMYEANTQSGWQGRRQGGGGGGGGRPPQIYAVELLKFLKSLIISCKARAIQ